MFKRSINLTTGGVNDPFYLLDFLHLHASHLLIPPTGGKRSSCIQHMSLALQSTQICYRAKLQKY